MMWHEGHAKRKRLQISDVLQAPAQIAGKEGEAKPKAKPYIFLGKAVLPHFKFEVVAHMLGEFGSCNASPGVIIVSACVGKQCAVARPWLTRMPFRVV